MKQNKQNMKQKQGPLRAPPVDMEVYATTSTSVGNRLVNRALNLHRSVKRKLLSALRRVLTPTTSTSEPPRLEAVIRPLDGSDSDGGVTTLVVDVDQLLLKRSSPAAAALFPPFFLVAVEAGGFVRGLVLLVLYPVLCLLTRGVLLRVMAVVCFCGLRRKEAARIGMAVLPRYFFREAAGMTALEELARSPTEVKVAAVSRTFPTVMVEAFLKEYMAFDAVVGREVKAVAGTGYLAGVMEECDESSDMERLTALLKQAEKREHRYPKPLIFHDGRLVFTPTPAAALGMYVYLPVAVVLAVVRIGIYTLLPRHVTRLAGKLTGVGLRVTHAPPTAPARGGNPSSGRGGQLYACNHRTLLDPIAISSAIGKPVTAVTFSLSRLSELLSPIPLLRLTREREEDRRLMSSLLSSGGDVVVCPEGTTCREPYLLRFSPLFAELADEVVPVAVETRASMFYGTSTAAGAKHFDSVYFLMNPRPEYSVTFMEPVRAPPRRTGKTGVSIANWVQLELAGALGFEVTGLTRKDKYALLAGHEGAMATAMKHMGFKHFDST